MANDVEVVTPNEKRPAEDENGLQTSRKKLKIGPSTADRNPIAILNDLRNGLKYEVLEQQGPPHAPVFTVAVVVDSQQYVGTGRSKKQAKCRAAETALKSFIQFPNNCKALSLNSSGNTKVDFTSDAFEGSQNKSMDNDSIKPSTQKNPVMVLNEMYPTTKYECVENALDLFARFKVTATIDGESFVGTGSNKKMARHAAALSALSKLLKIKPDEMQNYGVSYYRPSHITSEQQQWADNVARLVCEKFMSLMANDAMHARRKVLAGIVMNRDMQLEVISVATGTKCVSGEMLSMSGANLNDMHAEIVSRRCLQLFLYDQLLMLTQPDKADKSIFEANSEGPGYKLKPGIDFHLYINTAPCGDARIFCPSDKETDRHPNRNSRGRLRAKIESGEGTVPVHVNARTQNWDGIIQGERLLTMSCSDKIARWNVLGLQGCLLAHFIEPIYLKSIILGNLFNESHLYRAICGRIEAKLQGLSPPYKLNRPDMYLITSTETRHTVRAPNFSVNWTTGQDQVEIVKTVTGKPEQGVSRICKQIFARKFVEVLKSGLKPIIDIKLSNLECYSDAKDVLSTYKSAKDRLFDAFNKAGLGYWIQKPMEQDQFQLDFEEAEDTKIESE